MGDSGKTAAAAGGGATSAILLIPIFAHFGINLDTSEAIAMAGILAPVLHGVLEILGAIKGAILARIARRAAAITIQQEHTA